MGPDHVIFYLDGTPHVWLQAHEEELTSWELFKQKLSDLFGNLSGQQLAAKRQLATCAQSAIKPYVSYIQDVLALCHKIDTSIANTDKVGHILKGIADDAFNLLVFNATTVYTIIRNAAASS